MEQMTKERREAYVEVLEILNNMDLIYVEKVPTKLIEFFKDNSSKEYKFHLDKSIPFEEQNLKEITINVLAMLNLNYWCENEEHKKDLLKKYYDNEMKYREKIMEQYSTDKIFNKQRNETLKNVPQIYEENKWYKRTFDIIRKFVRSLFNKK